MGFSIDFAY